MPISVRFRLSVGLAEYFMGNGYEQDAYLPQRSACRDDEDDENDETTVKESPSELVKKTKGEDNPFCSSGV